MTCATRGTETANPSGIFTASDYPFGIFKCFFHMFLKRHM